MNQVITSLWPVKHRILLYRFSRLFPAFISGLLLPFGFAPFHRPGLAVLGLAIWFVLLHGKSLKSAFYLGFVFGLGFTGLGVSWVYISIHEYGHIHAIGSAFITFLFLIYLSLFPACLAVLYQLLTTRRSLWASCFIFSALWCLFEYMRASLMGGFPWLLLGFSQTDTPLQYTLPILGLYGTGFLASLAAAFLGAAGLVRPFERVVCLILCVLILIVPVSLKHKTWAMPVGDPINVGIIQANLSMRDKWDETLFWQLLEYYEQSIEAILPDNQLIVMPESAIPVPVHYISEILDGLDAKAYEFKSALLMGAVLSSSQDEANLYNAMISLGEAHGRYLKQHLVPFGEFIPKPFEAFMDWLDQPVINMARGQADQALIRIQNHPIAALICYELAYPQLLRKQLPEAEWIVSISDDGWFGHSFAMHQQLQMAAALSIQTARFQIMANNDGLSSLITNQGEIKASLPAFKPGTLESTLQPMEGSTPWVIWGDAPILSICLLICLIAFIPIFRR